MRSHAFVITNDDGPDSPLTQALVPELAKREWCNSVCFVLPAEEQSWIADAITRFRPLNVKPHKIASHKGYLVDGTPADCASLAIDHLHEGVKPQYLISGINMGTNAGLPFFLCSGTVGGATQSFLNGVPSVALSAGLPGDIYKMWLARDFNNLKKFEADFTRISNVCLNTVHKLIQNDAWKYADLFSINVAWSVDEESPLSFSVLTRGSYKPLFGKVAENQYRHQFQGFAELLHAKSANGTNSDIALIDQNHVSISAIRYNLEAILPTELIAKFKS